MEGHIVGPRNKRMEVTSRRQIRMEASCEGGQGPEGAVASWMDGCIVTETSVTGYNIPKARRPQVHPSRKHEYFHSVYCGHLVNVGNFILLTVAFWKTVVTEDDVVGCIRMPTASLSQCETYSVSGCVV